jgi:hypothetical protein
VPRLLLLACRLSRSKDLELLSLWPELPPSARRSAATGADVLRGRTSRAGSELETIKPASFLTVD